VPWFDGWPKPGSGNNPRAAAISCWRSRWVGADGEGTWQVFVNRKRILVEFGDCDPRQIVYYPRYFVWFDSCTWALFAQAGLPLPQLPQSHGVVGLPLVEARARFILPSSFGDELEVESGVIEWRQSSFVVQHRFFAGGELALEGFETRVWAARHPSDPSRMKAVPVPADVIERLSTPRNDSK